MIFPFVIAIIYLFFVVRIMINAVVAFRKPFSTLSHWQTVFLVLGAALYLFMGPIIGFIRYDEYPPDTPYFQSYDKLLIVLSLIGMVGFWISFLLKRRLNAFGALLATVAMWIGVVVCFANSLHFIPMAPLGVIWPMLGFELLSPYVAFLVLLRELNQLRISRTEMSAITRNSFWHRPAGEQLMFILPATAVVMLGICLLFTLWGYPENALALVFTESKGFLFSN